MSISRDDVSKVSLLARLLLSEEELQTMTRQMGQILQYMDLLNEVDTSRVEPMAHALEMVDVFREDQVRPSLAREQALANAPCCNDECYLVPPVLGEL
jgi:aspartyl-tRNA(Asn)/glutamyl-tRNA(Gln) amidotransferase subunit C